MSAVVCGFNVHKDRTYGTTLHLERKIINKKRMANEKVPSCLSHFKVGKVEIEASASVTSIHRQLVSERFDVVVSNPKRRVILLKI